MQPVNFFELIISQSLRADEESLARRQAYHNGSFRDKYLKQKHEQVKTRLAEIKGAENADNSNNNSNGGKQPE